MTLDTIERLDDFIILRHRPGLVVWCHPDGAPIVTEIDTGQRVIWCWSADSTMEQRDQTRQALIRGGWRGLAGVVAIGAVQPGEVERWVRDGYLVLVDAPAANRHVIAGIELEGEHGERLDRRRRRRPGPAGRSLCSNGSARCWSARSSRRIAMPAVTDVIIVCARCGAERATPPTAKGAPRLPRGWKRERDDSPICDRCWHAAYSLRAVVLPVAGPVDGTWDELRADLHDCWSDATRLANWATLELARADVVRRADMERLPAMPRVYLYPGARELVPDMDTGSVVALLQQVERRYRAARYDVVWRSARALPTYRYPTPYPVHNQRWSVALDEQGTPLVRVPLRGRTWTLRLRRKNRGRQLAAIRRLVDGEAHQGELAIYQRGGDVMCKLVLWLPRPVTAAQPKAGTLYVRTAADSFLVYHVDDGEPRYLHADDIRRVCAAHRRRLQRLADDTKAEKRRPRSERRGIERRRQEWARKYRNRLDSWTHEVTAMLANYAARQRVARVVYDDSARAYLPEAPYHEIRERLRYKLAAHGIELELASGEVVSDTTGPLDVED